MNSIVSLQYRRSKNSSIEDSAYNTLMRTPYILLYKIQFVNFLLLSRVIFDKHSMI